MPQKMAMDSGGILVVRCPRDGYIGPSPLSIKGRHVLFGLHNPILVTTEQCRLHGWWLMSPWGQESEWVLEAGVASEEPSSLKSVLITVLGHSNVITFPNRMLFPH